MANKRKQMLLIRRMIQLAKEKRSIRFITRTLKVSRNTVRSYLRECQSCGLEYDELLALDDTALSKIVYVQEQKEEDQAADARLVDLQACLPKILEDLKNPKVTRSLLWREYKQAFPEGYEYTQFCFYLKEHLQHQKAVMHFEHEPGEVLMVDLAGDELSYIDKNTGEIIYCPVFVASLPFSGFGYVEALPSAKMKDIAGALNRTLFYLGGVPASIKSDNLRQMVTKPCRYEPTFTALIEQLAVYYDTTLLAARVRKPRDKATVENGVWLSYIRIYAPLRNDRFFSLEELNRAILKKLDEHHSTPFQKKDYNRRDRFLSLEKPVLKPLPQFPFTIKHSASAKVQKNCHVILGEDWHQYSVPYQYIGKEMRLIYDEDVIEVYLDLNRIATHKRAYNRHGYTTLAEHLPEKHRAYLRMKSWDENYFLRKAQAIGPCTHKAIEAVLCSRRFTEQAYNTCLGILRLAETFSPERLEAACMRAAPAGIYNYKTLTTILINKMDQLQSDQSTQLSFGFHQNIRGPEAYQ